MALSVGSLQSRNTSIQAYDAVQKCCDQEGREETESKSRWKTITFTEQTMEQT